MVPKIEDVVNIFRFFIEHSASFIYINRWARKEIKNHPLISIADRFGSDKGFKTHGYLRIYDEILRNKRYQIKTMLEIGLLHPIHKSKNKYEAITSTPSLDMWAEFFPNAQIIGFDLDNFTVSDNKRIKIFSGHDQSKREDLANIVRQNTEYDIIIDDGSHASKHQQLSFSQLFSVLSSGGIYFIEDLHYQPSELEDNFPIKTIDCLKKLSQENVWASPESTKKEKEYIENNIREIKFYDSMSNGTKGADALAVIIKS